MDTVGQAPKALPTGTVAFLFTDIEGSTENLAIEEVARV